MLDSLQTQLDQLERSQLLRRDTEVEAAYLFKHALTQEAAYGSLLLKTRRDIHRRVAHSIETLYADQLDEQASVLSQHYAEAGDDEKTLEYASRSGDVALRLYAAREAVDAYSLALETVRRMPRADAGLLKELYLKRGRALELLSRFDDAAENYDRMLAEAEASRDQSFTLSALIAQALIRAVPSSARDHVAARRLAMRALQLARNLDDRPAQARILWVLLMANVYSGGDLQEAIEFGENSLAIARECNLREQTAFTLHDIFVAYSYQGDLEAAANARRESTRIFREMGNLPMLAEGLSGLDLVDMFRGKFDSALSLGREALEISRKIHNLGGIGFSGYTLGIISTLLGFLREAVEYFELAIPITDAGGMEGNGVSPHAEIAYIMALFGEFGRARDLIRAARSHAAVQLDLQRLWLSTISARVELRAGNLAAARNELAEVPVPSFDHFPRIFPSAASELIFARTEMLLAEDQGARAIPIADQMLAFLRQMGERAILPEALHLRAACAWQAGETDQARDWWNEAEREATAMGMQFILWQILAAQREAEQELGHTKAAEDAAIKAGQIEKRVLDHAPSMPSGIPPRLIAFPRLTH